MYSLFDDYEKIRFWFEGKDPDIKKQDVVDALRRFADFLEKYTEESKQRL